MNHDPDEISAPDDRWIDRLVDGELSPTDRRRLLMLLDESPDGWRRCALAFLEAREFRSAIVDLASSREPAAAPRAFPIKAALPRRRPAYSLFRWAAAALLLASSFGVGWASRPIPRGVEQGGASFAPRPEPDDRGGEAEPGQSIRGVGTLAFESKGKDGEEARRYRVPILAGPGLDANWIKNLPSPLTPYDRDRLRRGGYHVKQERRVISMSLKNGRSVAIPVDQVSLEYVGTPSY